MFSVRPWLSHEPSLVFHRCWAGLLMLKPLQGHFIHIERTIYPQDVQEVPQQHPNVCTELVSTHPLYFDPHEDFINVSGAFCPSLQLALVRTIPVHQKCFSNPKPPREEARLPFSFIPEGTSALRKSPPLSGYLWQEHYFLRVLCSSLPLHAVEYPPTSRDVEFGHAI